MRGLVLLFVALLSLLCIITPTTSVCTCDPADPIACGCYSTLNNPTTFNSSDPWGVDGNGCPDCPSLVMTCPDLIPSPHKAFVCHRQNGQYTMLEVGEAAIAGHLRHGDFVPTPETCCMCDMDLCDARMAAIDFLTSGREYLMELPASSFQNPVTRAQLLNEYLARSNAYLSEDATYIQQGVGVFSPRLIFQEYQLLLTPFAGDSFRLFRARSYQLDFFQNGDVVQKACVRMRINVPNFITGWLTLYDNYRTYKFNNGTALVNLYQSAPACRLDRPSDPQSPQLINIICSTLNFLCAGVPSYDFRDNVAGCVAMWTRLADKQRAIVNGTCNYQNPGSSDTSQCRQVHFISATVDPVVHCPHTNLRSVPCQDKPFDNPQCSLYYYPYD